MVQLLRLNLLINTLGSLTMCIRIFTVSIMLHPHVHYSTIVVYLHEIQDNIYNHDTGNGYLITEKSDSSQLVYTGVHPIASKLF